MPQGPAWNGIFDDLDFTEQWSRDDWTKSSWNSGYKPISADVVNAARAKWSALKDARDLGSPTAQSIMDGIHSRLASFIASVDSYTKAGSYGSGQTQGQNRIDAYNRLNAELSNLANLTVQDPEAEQAAIDAQHQADVLGQKSAADAKTATDAATAAKAASAVAARAQTADAIATAQAAIVAAQAAKQQAQASLIAHQQAAQVAADKSAALGAVMKPALLAAAIGIPLLILGVMALKSKSNVGVAGYRRRRSRR